MTHPLAGPRFTAPPDPKKCPVCDPPRWRLKLIITGRWECTRLDCPLRNYQKTMEKGRS